MAALRIIVSGVFLVAVVNTSFAGLGRLPVTILVPTGAMKLVPWSFYDRLFSPAGMTLLKCGLILFLLLSMFGFATSLSTKMAALLVIFYQGLVRSFGHFNHDEIIAVYFLIVLAFSPCGDALSLDSLRKPSASKPAFAYGYPILLMQALLAWAYFSSALIKLRVSGLTYFYADTLPTLSIMQSLDNLHDTHFRFAFLLPAIKSYTPIFVMMVLLWELIFPLAIFSKRLRWPILMFGVVFHVATLLLMNFIFLYHLLMYLVFIDWDRAIDRLRKARSIWSGRVRGVVSSGQT